MLCRIINPERVVFEEDVDRVVLPAEDGEVCVLPRHVPMIVLLKAGQIRVNARADGERIKIPGGFARITRNEVEVLLDGV